MNALVHRRSFLTFLGTAAAAWPLGAGAQQRAMPVIGLLNSESAIDYAYLVAAFRRGLGELGFVEGRNVVIEYRWAESNYDRLPALAAELVQRPVSVLAAIGAPATLPAKMATSTIPIVFLTGDDPVGAGLVGSLNRPSGNMTGVGLLNTELTSKRLELLRELVPGAGVLAILINDKNPSAQASANTAVDAAHTLGQAVETFTASADQELEQVFVTMRKRGMGGVLLTPDALFIRRSARLGTLAAQHGLPTIHIVREFADAGGLLSYGPNLADQWRQVGAYVGRLLKGDRPGDLPVMLPTRFELVLNMKTAKALSLAVPTSILLRADEIIE